MLRLDVNYFSRRYVLLTVLIRKETQRFHNVYITFWFSSLTYGELCSLHYRHSISQRVKWRIKCTFYQRGLILHGRPLFQSRPHFLCLPAAHLSSIKNFICSTQGAEVSARWLLLFLAERSKARLGPGLAHFFVVITAFTRQPGEAR